MVTLLPGGPFGQAANACFLFVGLFGDVLLIRFFLVLAYIFLLIGAATGYPRWTGFTMDGPVSVDGLVWSSVCLLLHGYALCSLVLDERRIKFKCEDEEQLWRFFYRRSGMGRLEMQQVLKYGRWLRVPAGGTILTERESQRQLCLLIEGQAAMHTSYHGMEDIGRLMLSGSVFDFGLLNVFGIYIGFIKDEHRSFRAVAHTDCLLYSWTVEELNVMATQLSPAVAAFWRNFVLSELGMEFDWRAHAGAEPRCATAEPERPGFAKGGRSRDFTDELRRYERQQRTLRGTLRWLWHSLHPFLPRGIRHTALPVSGILARNRVIALKAAEAWAALSREQEGGSADRGPGVRWTALQPAVAKPGTGNAVHRLLYRLQSMHQLQGADMQQLAQELLGEMAKGGEQGAAAAELVAAAAEAAAPVCPVPGCEVQHKGVWGK